MTTAATGLPADLHDCPSFMPDQTQLADLELLLSGAFGPLTGFMGDADAAQVRRHGRLRDGTAFPFPVTMDVPAGAVPPDAARLVLEDPESVPLAVLQITDRTPVAGGAAVRIGGDVRALRAPEHGPFRRLRRRAGEVTAELRASGTGRGAAVLACATRAPLHHRELAQLRESAAGLNARLLLLPLVAGAADLVCRPDALVRAVLAALPELPRDTLVVPVPLAPRGADGARDEVLARALVAAAYGATHLFAAPPLPATPAQAAALAARPADTGQPGTSPAGRTLPHTSQPDTPPAGRTLPHTSQPDTPPAGPTLPHTSGPPSGDPSAAGPCDGGTGEPTAAHPDRRRDHRQGRVQRPHPDAHRREPSVTVGGQRNPEPGPGAAAGAAGVGATPPGSPIPVVTPAEWAFDRSAAMWRPAARTAAAARLPGLARSELASLLDSGGDIPDWFTPAAVARELRAARPPRRERGLVILFTGLSGAGKSTVARDVSDAIAERGDRTVSLLDGDHVRRLLSAGLGFSRPDRDLNIVRIGFVAAEIARHGGVAICAPIAPYAAARAQVRQLAAQTGDFLLVHVSTPIEACEARDRKGMYAKARAGVITGFTGVSDPYEEPDDADLVLDTSVLTREEAAEAVLGLLTGGGWLAGRAAAPRRAQR